MVIQLLELVPLGDDTDAVGILAGLVGVPHHGHLLERRGALRLQVLGMVPVEFVHGQVALNLVFSDLGVIDAEQGLVAQQAMADVDGGGFSRVARVLLEGESQHGDLFPGDGVEHGRHHALHESRLLVVIDRHDLFPVVGDFGEAVALADVDQVEDVFLEAGATEAHTGVKKLGADSGVFPNRVGYLVDVGAGGFAERGHGVDGGDSLRQERVGGQLGELRGPQVGCDDVILRDPVRVHGLECGDGSLALGGHAAADEHAVGFVEVGNGGALGKKLRIGQDLEVDPFVVVREDLLDGLRGLHRDRGLLHHDLVALGHIRDHPCRALPIGEIRGLAGSQAARLCGGVHGHEHNVRLGNVLLHFC